MSNEALTWAFRQNAPSTGAKFILVALADQANHEHRAWPGQQKLAAMTGQGVRTVLRHLIELEGAGLLVRERRNAGYTKRLPDGFRLPVTVVASTPTTRNIGTQTHANLSRVDLTPVNVTPAKDDEDTRQTGRIKEPKEQPKEQEPKDSRVKPTRRTFEDTPEFAKFWEAYPRRKAKGAARDSFRKAVERGVSAEQIADGAARYARACRGKDEQFVAHAATWLNQERWDDEYQAPSTAASGGGWWNN